MSNAPVEYGITTASAEDVDLIITKIDEVLEGTAVELCVMAMLAITIRLMRPELDNDQVTSAIEEVSKQICLITTDENAPQPASKLMN